MTKVHPGEAEYLLSELLREVSRSFYLTLKVLPAAIRPQIGLAYLLARATDTIADTDLVPLAVRLQALQELRDAIESNAPEKPSFQRLLASQATDGERILLERISSALKLLRTLSPEDQARIRKVLQVITSGQELDLVRFDSGTAEDPVALHTEAELHDYTWRVAGCVGEFWTEMCLAHLRPQPAMPLDELLQHGIRYGKGLQLINILRDIPADLRKGRCYIPTELLDQAGLVPRDLLDHANYPAFAPLYQSLLLQAGEHLQSGWTYTVALPYSWFKLRLACAWPILIGQDTLAKLAQENVLDPARRVKTSRKEVRSILLKSVALYLLRQKWETLGRRSTPHLLPHSSADQSTPAAPS